MHINGIHLRRHSLRLGVFYPVPTSISIWSATLQNLFKCLESILMTCGACVCNRYTFNLQDKLMRLNIVSLKKGCSCMKFDGKVLRYFFSLTNTHFVYTILCEEYSGLVSIEEQLNNMSLCLASEVVNFKHAFTA